MLGGYLYNAIGKPNISFYMSAIKLAVILAIIYPLTARYGLGRRRRRSPCRRSSAIRSAWSSSKQVGLELSSTLGVLARVIAACAVMMGVVLGGVWLLSPSRPGSRWC